MDLALDAVEAAFRKLALDEAENVPRQRCQTDHVMLHVLPAAAKTLGVIGFKAYTTSKHGREFHVTLFDGKTGELTAILEADHLGQVRTGAASGVATKKLARPDAATVGLLRHRQAGPHAAPRGVQGAARSSRSTSTAATRSGGRRSPRRLTSRDAASRSCRSRSPRRRRRGWTSSSPRRAAASRCCSGEWLARGAAPQRDRLELPGEGRGGRRGVPPGDAGHRGQQGAGEAGGRRLRRGARTRACCTGPTCTSSPRSSSAATPAGESPQDVTVFKSLGLGIEDIALGARRSSNWRGSRGWGESIGRAAAHDPR